VRANAGENRFCHPESEQKPKEQSLPVASIPHSSTTSWQESPPQASKATLSKQLWQVVQNLLPWRQRTESIEQSIAASIMVISTHSAKPMGAKQNSDQQRINRGFLQYSQRLTKPSVATTTPTEKEQFQVWVKKQLIAQFPQQQQAELMAQRLKQFFSQPSEAFLSPSSIEATLFEGLPALKIGDHLLFKIDNTLAKALNRNPEIIAIDWVNNLRNALGKTPLPLAEAQRRMHKLVETSQKFEGTASWYGTIFHGRPTATGETYDQHELTAAHPTLPFDTYLKVKNQKNGDSVIVRINDRGPYVPGRALDLSQEAARCLHSEKVGVVPFEAVVMQPSSSQTKPHITKN
jgi:rare lipoprotein A